MWKNRIVKLDKITLPRLPTRRPDLGEKIEYSVWKLSLAFGIPVLGILAANDVWTRKVVCTAIYAGLTALGALILDPRPQREKAKASRARRPRPGSASSASTQSPPPASKT